MDNSFPNIFTFATKEFTTDAMIMWFANCCKLGDENPVAKRIGESFFRNLIFKGKTLPEKFIIEADRKQLSKIDVYICLQDGSNYYPIIFENKADTTYHDDQIKNYCKNVVGWFNNPKDFPGIQAFYTFVYLKTGFLYETNSLKKYFEKDWCNQFQLRIIGLDELASFLRTVIDEETPSILRDYYTYCTKKLVEQQNIEKHWRIDKNSLSSDQGQYLFYKCFDDDDRMDPHVDIGGGRSWIYSLKKFNGNDEHLCYKFKSGGKFIQLQCFRGKEEYLGENGQSRYDQLMSMLHEFQNNDGGNNTVKVAYSKKYYPKRKELELLKIEFDDDMNQPGKVVDYLKCLTKKILETL